MQLSPLGCACLIAAALSVSCSAAAAQEQRAEIAQATAQVDNDIAAAEADSAKYSGGLVKAIIESRLHTLKQTRAMLDQRAKSWTFGIGLRYTVDGRAFTSPQNAETLLASVETEIKNLTVQIARQQTEADRYSGGLVRAMHLSTLATSQQTLAMLEQKRLALKFGLPQFIGFANASASSPADAPTPPAGKPAAGAPQANQKGLFEIVAIDSRITESNRVWSRFAWKLTIRNHDKVAHTFNATIEFQDSEGFVVDDDDEYGLTVPPGSEQVFTGFDLVSADVVGKVARTNAKVGLAR